MDQNPRRRSIDGFYTKPASLQPRPKLDQYNTPVPKPDTPPLPQAADQSGSILNKSLSNNSLGMQLSASPTKSSKVKSSKLKWFGRHKLWTSVLVLLVIVFGGGSWLGFKFFDNIAKLTHNYNPFAVISSALNQVNLKSQGDWVNILVAGYDPADGDITTDTIMVVSVNKKTDQAIMLSIPRDTWVNNLPGFGHQKINAANDASSFSAPGYPKGGMGELEQQVHDKLGITSDYYALVNNQAYVQGVNAIGGIDVNIQSSDPRGLYDPNVDKPNGGPLNLSNGWHHLNGLQALGLVKARGDSPYAYGFPNSDFDREAHARQVVIAMKDKALTTGVFANPVKISHLLDTVGNNVQTDITLNDATGFYSLMKKVNNNNIKSLSLVSINGQKLLTGQVIDGLDVEAPTAGVDNFSQIKAEVASLYSSNPVFREAATVVILNGSNVNGLALQEETTLDNNGLDVTSIGDPSTNYPNTMIIDQSKGKDPASLKELQTLFPTNTTTTTSTTTPAEATEAKNYPTANFVVILGQNWNSTKSNN